MADRSSARVAASMASLLAWRSRRASPIEFIGIEGHTRWGLMARPVALSHVKLGDI